MPEYAIEPNIISLFWLSDLGVAKPRQATDGSSQLQYQCCSTSGVTVRNQCSRRCSCRGNNVDCAELCKCGGEGNNCTSNTPPMIGEYLEDDWINANYEHLISNIWHSWFIHVVLLWQIIYLFMLYQKNVEWLPRCVNVLFLFSDTVSEWGGGDMQWKVARFCILILYHKVCVTLYYYY